MGSSRWPNWQVALSIGIGLLLYLRSPIDLLPDHMGAFGFLDDLIVLVVGVFWLRQRLSENGGVGTPPRARAPDAVPSDPYEILEVTPGASPEEITRGYREQMKRYHPDRVVGLGAELQRVAHERTIAIQRAYEAIGRR